MVAAVRQSVTVEDGGVVRVQSPDLEPGSRAEVIVMVEAEKATTSTPLMRFKGAAKGRYASAEAVDQFLRKERDAWSDD